MPKWLLCSLLIPLRKLLFWTAAYMVLPWGFGVPSLRTSQHCGQEKPGVHLFKLDLICQYASQVTGCSANCHLLLCVYTNHPGWQTKWATSICLQQQKQHRHPITIQDGKIITKQYTTRNTWQSAAWVPACFTGNKK